MLDKIWVPDKRILAAKSTTALEKMLTDLFSQYIRRKYADPHTGLVECFTCGRRFHWKDVDCGHYVSRKNMNTKFDELNNHPQCRFCNRRINGNLAEYKKRLDIMYGIGTAATLEAKGRQTRKFMRNEYMDMIMEIKAKLDRLQ